MPVRSREKTSADTAPASAPAPSAVSLIGVSRAYRRGEEEVVALDDITFDLRERETVAVVGRSGSGKSTLLHIAGGLDVPDRGRVLLGGRDIAGLSADERAEVRRSHVGFVFQFFHLLPDLTVAENVALPLILDNAGQAEERALAQLERVQLADKARRFPGELSGGEMQRVAVARALVAGPKVILADEPTGNLDSVTGAAVLDVLMEQATEAGAALLLVTHDDKAAARAQRAVTVADGRIVS